MITLLKINDDYKQKNTSILKKIRYESLSSIIENLEIAETVESISQEAIAEHLALQNEQAYEQELLWTLKIGGYDAYRHKQLTSINLITLEFERKESVRNLMLLPSVNRRIKAERRKQLKAYVYENGYENKVSTLTANIAFCRTKDVRGERQKAVKRFEKLRAKLKSENFEVIYTPIEFSEMWDQEDNLLWNIHTHIIGVQIGPIDDWDKIHGIVHKYLAKPGTSPKLERVKAEDLDKTFAYCTKPIYDGRKKREGISPEELAEFARQIEGLKLAEPQGGFRKFVAKLNRDKQRIEKSGDRIFKTDKDKNVTPDRYAGVDNRILRITRPKYLGETAQKAPCAVVDDFTTIEDLLADKQARKTIDQYREMMGLESAVSYFYGIDSDTPPDNYILDDDYYQSCISEPYVYVPPPD